MNHAARIAIALSLLSLPAFADRLSPEEALAKMTVADGLQVKTFAADPEIVSISNIDVDHRGRVWACECVNYRGNRGKRPEGDRILILEDTDGDGVSDVQTVFYQGTDIDIAMGLCVLGNKAIVAASPNILMLEDTDGDDVADKKTIILTSDAEFQHDHSLHSFVFGPDGRFYGNFGNTGKNLKDATGKVIIDRSGREIADNGKPFWGGMVFRCDREFKNFEVLGHNFRNNYEATVDSFGGVWQSDNDDDGNLAVRLNYILEGGNYGYLDELTGQRWRAPRIGMHPHRGKAHWHQNDPGAVPNVIETGNGAPGGVTVYEGDLLPESVRNQVLFCEAGGHRLWALPVTEAGAGLTAGKIEVLRSPDNNFRPVDVAVAPDGSVLVSDWYDPVIGGFRQDDIERGRIYWIAPKGHRYEPPKIDLESAEGAVRALRSPNYCARYLAWMVLHELGAQAEAPLRAMLKDGNPRLRARALWLLGQIPGKEGKYIQEAIEDAHPDVRVVGLRLADLVGHKPFEVLSQLVKDPSPRVRAQCAVHLRHHQGLAVSLAWATLASEYEGADRWYLEALGIGADGKWDECLVGLLAFPDGLTAKQWKDIIWRSRGGATARNLAKIILDAKPEEDVRRYVRAFDFQAGPQKDEALLEVAMARTVTREIALEALQRIPAAKLGVDEKSRTRLVELLAGGTPTPTSLRLVKELKLSAAYPWLLEVAQEEQGDQRVDAIRALLDLGQQEMIAAALAGDDPAKALATGRVLAQLQHGGARDLLWTFLQNDELGGRARKETAREWAKSKAGAEQLLERITGDGLSEELKQAVASVLLTHRDGTLRARAENAFPLAPGKNSEALPVWSELVAMNGDARSGRNVFFKQGQCAACHRVKNEGQEVGPDLSQAGTKLARSALLEAIIYPSAAISHNYENYTAKLADGTNVTGVLVNRGEREMQLRDAQGVLQTLDRTVVKSFERLKVSLMPANLHQLMTTQELADLVEYLVTLK